MTAEQRVARGRALIGVRFRPQGRCAATGVDCVGIVAIACRVPGDRVRKDYSLRENDVVGPEADLRRLGFNRVAPDEARAGDVLLVKAGFSQLHLVLLTPEGFVHADAGMRRVVEVPGAARWPVVSAWRVGA